MLPAVVLLLWAVATLGWWAFAFLPLPSAPPPWLTAARSACFGAVDDGWPSAAGWMLLVPAPAMLFGGIVALWGAELGPSLRRAARSWTGRVVFGALALALAVEASWVAAKIRAAGAVGGWASAATAPDEVLPADYPRRTLAAPDFALVDQDGRAVSLRALRGRPVVISFVFAHCQTLCPLVVQTLKTAVPGEGSAAVLLVTLDPWRDTPRVLDGLARQWSVPPHFRVLSAPAVDDVLAVIRAYDVPAVRNETTGDIVHPALVFLVDADGRLAYTFNNPPPRWVREGLARLG